jgi:glycerate dehydrogenase
MGTCMHACMLCIFLWNVCYAFFLSKKPGLTRAATAVQAMQVVSLHCNLDKSTHHLINKERLQMMKPTAVIINAARGPCIDESALVSHLKANPDFFAGLDVFEDEPAMKPGLAECHNAVVVPHIASASLWTRSGMATLAACNVAACLQGYSAYNGPDVIPFVDGPFQDIPKLAPSIVNAKDIGMSVKS